MNERFFDCVVRSAPVVGVRERSQLYAVSVSKSGFWSSAPGVGAWDVGSQEKELANCGAVFVPPTFCAPISHARLPLFGPDAFIVTSYGPVLVS